ncbi:hypothetical protein [Bacillus cereus]|uniref:hypothetical protein n=2 Tax=Bacillus cereus TaxID=1396 RepID=UPI000BF48E3D|nr:hypothetical protein [Bacillus cereus]PFI68971.1 hypothetical protein COI85_28595 [Bacillus cereus]
MKQANLVKYINDTYKLGISQKIVKERIDKIYKFIREQIKSNKDEFNINDLTLFQKYIKTIEQKDFNYYTGAIFCSLLLLYQNERLFRSRLKGKIINSIYIEDFVVSLETYIKKYLVECYREGLYEGYENNGTHFISIFKSFFIKIFDTEKILEEELNDKLKSTEGFMQEVEKLSVYRKNAFMEKLNKRLEKLIQKEEWILREELREAIIKHDSANITGSIAELRAYYGIENNQIMSDEKVFKDLESTLLHSKVYSPTKTINQIAHFRGIVATYEDEKAFQIISNLRELMDKKEDILISFIEEIISLYEQNQEIEDKIIKERQTKTKDALFLAGRLRSKTELKELLEQREEYLYIRDNDKQVFTALQELQNTITNDENQLMLLNIDFILKYYKRFLMEKH